jgi:hypothetical protein
VLGDNEAVVVPLKDELDEGDWDAEAEGDWDWEEEEDELGDEEAELDNDAVEVKEAVEVLV